MLVHHMGQAVDQHAYSVYVGGTQSLWQKNVADQAFSTLLRMRWVLKI